MYKIIIINIFLLLSIVSCKQSSEVVRPNAVVPNTNILPACLAIDTDGDGIRDCEDPDIDNDGKTNQMPNVSLNRLCYQQNSQYACNSSSTTAIKCVWTTTNKCVSEKSCGINITKENCEKNEGCNWDSSNNICDQNDWFSMDKNEFKDSDFDGVGDNSDAFPFDKTETIDTLCYVHNNQVYWCQQLGDNLNFDDDWDGVPDFWDKLPKNVLEQFDTNNDSIGNNTQFDDDWDGVPDFWDDMPFNGTGYFDIDHDLIPNESDLDIDGDGIANTIDAFPYDSTEWTDTDNDKIGNNIDPDIDNDGVPNLWDAFAFDVRYFWDADNDGVANEIDAFPYNSSEWADSDGDGYGDNIDAFPSNPLEWKDTDLDGVGDNSDPDADGDGRYNTLPPIGSDNMNLACFKQLNEVTCNATSITNNTCKWTTQNRCVSNNSCGIYVNQSSCNAVLGCEWQGNVCLNSDMFPINQNEYKDSYYDGLGDTNEDFDIDHDGVPNLWDDFKLDNKSFVDTDNDGLVDFQLPVTLSDFSRNTPDIYGQKIDFDNDNDGVPDFWDAFQGEASEQFDIDNDGIGNNIDVDRDGDNVPNNLDLFSYDNNEWSDNDNDQIGNNADFDDDNDGIPDFWDVLPFNNNGFSDINNDGIPDQIAIDIDGDARQNGAAPRVLRIPLDIFSGYITPYGVVCGLDTNNDNIPDLQIGNSINNFSCSYILQTNVGGVYTTTYPEDEFVFDSTEWSDTNCLNKNRTPSWCGIGDNLQFDDDWDGVPDFWDDNDLDARGFSDINRNGIPDQVDEDIDGDKNPNNLESNTLVSPYGVFCGIDTDADGLPDTISTNNFFCAYRNSFDDFTFDIGEAVDTDGDGIGDNTDFDDDGDGVPDYWDAFPLDKNYYWDNDNDGIANELDTITPNGINSQNDIILAINNNEDVIINSNIELNTCINLPEGKRFASSTNEYRIKYVGSSNSCVINIVRATPPSDGSSLTTTIGNLYFELPKNIDNIKILTSSGGNLDELDMTQLFFRIDSQSIIADVYVRNQFRFVRNDLLLTTNYTMPAGYNNMINVRTSSPAISDYQLMSFGGNIVFWKLKENQNQNISIFKMHNPMRKIIISSNVLKLEKDTGVTLSGNTSFINGDFDYNSASSDLTKRGSFEVSLNRVNMNYGQFLNIISTNNSLDQLKTKSYANSFYGITTSGNLFADKDVTSLIGLGCEDLTDKQSCEGNLSCSWSGGSTTTGNYCSLNMGLAVSSFSTYYDFKETDVFLNPGWNDYSMFYYPSTTKMANSPALFDAGQNNEDDLNIVQSVDLGDGYIYHVGAYGPVKDTDGDGYRDEIDAFPFDSSEWRDSNKNGIGNNADLDDDSDLLLDINEKSSCQQYDNEISCSDHSICSWDASKVACIRKSNYCEQKTSMTTCNNDSLCSWNNFDNVCEIKSSQKGCLIENTTWNQADMCCKNASNQCVDGSDPYVQDTDSDGLSDYQEINTYHTNPILKDSDNDGETDADEIAAGTNPNDALSSKDTDHDGLSDKYEKQNLIPLGCVQPHIYSDTDGDGLSDYNEVMINHTNPCNNDSDNDGINDYDEVNVYNTNPNSTDTDGDGLSDYQEINTYNTNPNIVDTDGDGVPDGNEIANYTDPLNSSSFVDTDDDGEPDYTDKTPYGVIPYPTCTNTSLNNCTTSFTNDQLLQEFQNQWTEVTNCSSKISQSQCETTARNLCKWDINTSKCLSKPITLTKDISFVNSSIYSSCLLVQSTADVTIRSPKNMRKTITIDNSMASNASCLINSATINSQTIYPFIFLASGATNAANLHLENIKMITSSNMPTLISTKSTGAKNNQVHINNSELYSTNKNGATLLYLMQPNIVNIEKTTIRMDLDLTNSPNNSSLFNAIDIRNDGSVSSTVNLKGNMIYCDLKNYVETMFNTGKSFNCLNTQLDNINFEGNVVYLDDSVGLSTPETSAISGSNNIIAMNHQAISSASNITMKNSRIYSKSKTIKVVNNASSLTPTILNLGIINDTSMSQDYFQYTGNGSSSFTVNLLPNIFSYNEIFVGTTNLIYKCNGNNLTTDSEIESGLIHPGYFKSSPGKDYFNLIMNNSISRNIQTVGAKNEINCP